MLLYLPEELVGDVRIADARVVSHDAILDQVGSYLWFFGCNVNLRTQRTVDEVLVNDDEAASIDGEAPENSVAMWNIGYITLARSEVRNPAVHYHVTNMGKLFAYPCL